MHSLVYSQETCLHILGKRPRYIDQATIQVALLLQSIALATFVALLILGLQAKAEARVMTWTAECIEKRVEKRVE